MDAQVARDWPDALPVLTVDAGWRRATPTGKQMALLERLHIPAPKGLTRGQASWMIMLARQSAAPRPDGRATR